MNAEEINRVIAWFRYRLAVTPRNSETREALNRVDGLIQLLEEEVAAKCKS